MPETSSEAAEAGPPRRALVGATLVSLLAPLLVYWPTPGDYWIRFDNEILIRQEPMVRALALAGAARGRALVEMFTSVHNDLYQPLLTLSLAIDYALFGWDRSGFHLHSLLLHLAIAAGLFWLAYRLVGVVWASLLATLLFALHPLAVEPVSWVIHRTLLVTAAWVLVGSHAYLGYARRPERWPWLALATAAYGLSCMAKVIPSIALIPFLLDAWLRRPPSARLVLEKLPLLLVAGGFTLLNLRVGQLKASGAEPDLWGSVTSGGTAGGFALSLVNTVMPQRLALFYPTADVWSIVGARWLVLAVTLAGLLALGLWLWRRGARGLLLGCLGWLALVAPFVLAANAFRDVATADRYSYVAMLVLAPGVADALAALARAAPTARRLALATGWALVLVLGLQARAQARLWSDEASLWRAALAGGSHPVAYGALGTVYSRRQQWPQAVEAYERAVELIEGPYASQAMPLFYTTLTQIALGAAAAAPKNTPEASALRDRYLESASRAASRAAERWPDVAELHYQVARVDHRRGEDGQAIEALERALRLDRSHAPALEALGGIFELRGEYARAAPLYLRWVALRPRDARAHERFLSVALAGLEQRDRQAVGPWVERYLERFPDSEPSRRLRERLAAAGPG